MTEAMRGYLLSVTASAFLLSLVQAVLPKGSVRQIASFCGGLLVLLAVLSPLARLDYDEIASILAKLQLQTEASETGITVENRDLMAQIIKQRCETYILDKAKEQGLDVEVEIIMHDGTSYPYPDQVAVRGIVPAGKKQMLSQWIEENLGIPSACQVWESG